MAFMLTLDYRTFTDKSHLIYVALLAILLYVLFFGAAAPAEDRDSRQGSSGPVCGTPGGSPFGDAVIGTTRVLVILETVPTGTSSGTSTRIRVYIAADCGLLLDEPLAG